MAIVPNNINTLKLGIGSKTFNLGVHSDPNSYKIEEQDNNTKLITAADGTKFIATLNEKGQLITKIIKPNSPNDNSGRVWGEGAAGDQVTLSNLVMGLVEKLNLSNLGTWLNQSGTQKVQNNASTGESNQAVATFYAPGQGDISMQGGTKDRQGKSLIGHRVEDIVDLLKTYKSQGLSKEQALEKLKEGDHYIGVAADHTDPNNKYGTKISINSDALSQRFKLNEIYEGLNFSDLHVKIVDTGGAFVGKGPRRLDIAMANIKTAYDIGKVDLSWSALN